MANILLVEDDPILGRGLAENLMAEGYKIDWATNLQEARLKDSQQAFDLLILDLNLPDGYGLSLCQEIRSRNSRIPIVVLTAKSDEESVITGLISGANDYVKKPFGLGELLARVKVALREPTQREEQIKIGPLLVLLGQNRVLIEGKELHLNRREFHIFSHLAKHMTLVVSREQIIERLGHRSDLIDRTIDSHLSHIRTKIRKLGVQSVVINGVYGVGYKMEIA